MTYSTEVLEANGIKLGLVTASLESLRFGSDYILADTTTDSWTPGYWYRGLNVTGKNHTFLRFLIQKHMPQIKIDVVTFSREELLEIINSGRLATEA